MLKIRGWHDIIDLLWLMTARTLVHGQKYSFKFLTTFLLINNIWLDIQAFNATPTSLLPHNFPIHQCLFLHIYIISILQRYFVDRFRILTVRDTLPCTMDKKNYYLYM